MAVPTRGTVTTAMRHDIAVSSTDRAVEARARYTYVLEMPPMGHMAMSNSPVAVAGGGRMISMSARAIGGSANGGTSRPPK